MSNLSRAPVTSPALASFSERLIAWQTTHGRHDLPWQVRDPYRVWLSEIMLQQTQVSAVIGYYARFLERFPTVQVLAAAPLGDVLALWSGLGYYARARNLHRCAMEVVEKFSGKFPQSAQELATLPGIGPSTAAAIAAFCFGERVAILDGNVKRVLCRYLGIAQDPSKTATIRQLWQEATRLLPNEPTTLAQQMARYTQGIMDLGATVCTPRAPNCGQCPVAQDCAALQQGLTQSLPLKPPRRARPERSQIWLLPVQGDRVWLQRQAENGLWGGLWVPPAFDSLEQGQAWAMQQYGQELDLSDALSAFSHVFTHFTLQVQAYVLRVQNHGGKNGTTQAHVAESGQEADHGLWWPKDQLQTIGMPTPVKRLLADLDQPRQMHLVDGP